MDVVATKIKLFPSQYFFLSVKQRWLGGSANCYKAIIPRGEIK